MSFNDAKAEQAKKCEAAEGKITSEEESDVALTDEQLKGIAGGLGSDDGKCPGTGKNHYWYDTCETRPSKFGSSYPPDRKMRCKNCGTEKWQRVLMA